MNRFLIIVLVVLNLLALSAAQGLLGTTAPRGEPERLTNQIRPEALVLRDVDSGSAANPPAAPATRPPPSNTVSPPPLAVAPSPPPQPLPPPPRPEPTPSPAPDTPPAPPPAATPSPVAEVADATQIAAPTPICVAFSGLDDPQATALSRLMGEHATLQTRRSQTDPASNWWVHIPPYETRQAAEARVRELRTAGIADLFIVRDQGPNLNAISLGIFRTEASATQHLSDLRNRRIQDARMTPRIPARFRVEVSGPPDAIERARSAARGRWPDLQTGECAP